MADGIPTFDSRGRLLGNLTSEWGIPPVPSVPDIGGSATLSAGGAVLKSAATKAGIVGAGTPPAATTGTPGATTGGSVAANWFARAVIVILGLVFVAVGLSQFGRG